VGSGTIDVVEFVRHAMEAAVRKPEPDWAVMDASFHPDHEFVSLTDSLEGGQPGVGGRGFNRWRRQLDELFEWEIEIEDLREIPDGRLVLISRTRLVGTRGGVPIEFGSGAIIVLRDGLIWRTVAYPSTEETIAAAGLEP
jgi:ketosteroid isomerase-like protein